MGKAKGDENHRKRKKKKFALGKSKDDNYRKRKKRLHWGKLKEMKIIGKE